MGHAENYRLEPQLLAAMIYQESKFDPDARSSSGAVGLMQLLPGDRPGDRRPNRRRQLAARGPAHPGAERPLRLVVPAPPAGQVRRRSAGAGGLQRRPDERRRVAARRRRDPVRRDAPLRRARAGAQADVRRGVRIRARASLADAYIAAVADVRDREYAELLVGTCLDVQPGWQVLVLGSPLGRPLLEEAQRAIARRGAYALTEVTFGSTLGATDRAWVLEAPLDVLGTPAPLYDRLLRDVDAFLVVVAPENTRDSSAIPPEPTPGSPGGVPSSHRAPALARGCRGSAASIRLPALAQDAGHEHGGVRRLPLRRLPARLGR